MYLYSEMYKKWNWSIINLWPFERTKFIKVNFDYYFFKRYFYL